MTLESQPRGSANPSTRDDLVTQERWLLVVDLVTYHNPQQLGLIDGWRCGKPVGYSCFLDPAELDYIVDVA